MAEADMDVSAQDAWSVLHTDLSRAATRDMCFLSWVRLVSFNCFQSLRSEVPNRKYQRSTIGVEAVETLCQVASTNESGESG